MRLNAAAAVAVLGALFLISDRALGQAPPATVRIDQARSEPLETWRESTGEIRASRRSVLAAEEEGLVAEVLVREGDRVEAGQVIARIDDQRATLELRRAEAFLESVKAVEAEREALVDNARRDLERVQQTFDRGGGNEREIDQARTDLRAAEARLAASRADVVLNGVLVDLAKTRVEDMIVRAPFSGRIVRRNAEAGQWLGAGDPVAELVSLETVEAWIDVPERLIGRLTQDDGRVRVRVTATGDEVEAERYTIVPDADTRSRLFPVRVVLANEQERFRPGMSVIGLTPTGVTEATLTVHKDAMLRDDAGEYVYFAVPGQGGGFAAAPARVTRLFASGERVAIRANAMPPGAMVVIEGNERMFPMQPLNILNMPADQQPAQGAGSDGRG